jgi:hypothetical protein
MKIGTSSAQGNSYLIVRRKFKLKELLIALAYFLLLFSLLPLEYDNIRARTFVYPLIYVSAAYVLYKALFERSSEKYAIGLVGGIIAFFFIIYYFLRLIGFCAWSDFGILYVNRNDKSDKIIMRGYGCFLTDTDTQLFEEREITKHLKWVTNFDEKPINTTKWQKVF